MEGSRGGAERCVGQARRGGGLRLDGSGQESEDERRWSTREPRGAGCRLGHRGGNGTRACRGRVRGRHLRVKEAPGGAVVVRGSASWRAETGSSSGGRQWGSAPELARRGAAAPSGHQTLWAPCEAELRPGKPHCPPPAPPARGGVGAHAPPPQHPTTARRRAGSGRRRAPSRSVIVHLGNAGGGGAAMGAGGAPGESGEVPRAGSRAKDGS